MISKLTIHGYKSIEDLSIDCSRINLLTGSNMSGKTAVMEALPPWRMETFGGVAQPRRGVLRCI